MVEPAIVDIRDLAGLGGGGRNPTFCVAMTGTGAQVVAISFPFKNALVGFTTNGAAVIISRDGRTTIPTGQFGGLGGGMALYNTTTNSGFGALYFVSNENEKIYVSFPSAITVSLIFENLGNIETRHNV